MNKHKYPATLKEIKGRRSIKDYKKAMKSGSKSQPSSPSTIRRNQLSRVDDQRKLSRSMPKTTEYSPRSNNHYGEDSIDETSSGQSKEEAEEGICDEESKFCSIRYNEREIDYECSLEKEAFLADMAKKKSSCTTKAQVSHKRDSSTIKIFCFVMVIIIMLSGIWWGQENNSLHNKGWDNIKKIKAQFPSQDQDFWSAIIAGLRNVLENDSERTTVFLFLNSNLKDRKTINDLSENIAEFAADRLGTYKPIVLSPADVLALKDENGYFIHKYRPKLEKQKVLLIHNLHEIPANVAQSFHYFCDSENPIVQKSVIIFTMDIPNLAAGDSLLHVVENTLQSIWSPPLNDNVIHPLITRLTTNVVAVTPELIYYG